jgi:hypothetical protein
MLLFALLPPALALGLLYGILLSITATGTYTLARHLGCSRAGAFLAGFSFVWSGFFVCQMRHLGIIGTVAFFPYALYCLDRALLSVKTTPTSPCVKPQTFAWLMLFALCFGMQVLAGFPQTAYICGLFYGLLILWRLLTVLSLRPYKVLITTLLTLVSGISIATLLGTLMGMNSLLPVWELGTLSDRAGGLSFDDVISVSYPPKFLMSFSPPIFMVIFPISALPSEKKLSFGRFMVMPDSVPSSWLSQLLASPWGALGVKSRRQTISTPSGPRRSFGPLSFSSPSAWY